MYFELEPEVAGGLGENSVLDSTIHPPSVKHLHYSFDGWLGDCLLESFPCFIVSEQLSNAMEKSELTGYSLSSVEVTKSEQFLELHSELELPIFYRLNITGNRMVDDFSLSDSNTLLASNSALELLKENGLTNCQVSNVS